MLTMTLSPGVLRAPSARTARPPRDTPSVMMRLESVSSRCVGRPESPEEVAGDHRPSCRAHLEAGCGVMPVRSPTHNVERLPAQRCLDPSPSAAPRACLVLQTMMHGHAPATLAFGAISVGRVQRLHAGDGLQLELRNWRVDYCEALLSKH